MTNTDKERADFEAWWESQSIRGVTAREIAMSAYRAGREAERAEAVTDAHPLHFTYRNWRGEISERRVVPVDVRFGSTEWHPEPQWFLVANDLDKGETRWFAMRDIGHQPKSDPSPDAEALLSKAAGQIEYWRAKQASMPSLEDGVSEDGEHTPIGDEKAWEAGYANGRYSEADWWLSTIREWTTQRGLYAHPPKPERSPAPHHFDAAALEVARAFTFDYEPKKRAELQVAIVDLLHRFSKPETSPDVEALRSALEDAEELLALVEMPSFPDPRHHDRVKSLGREIGFGALMSTASAGWRESAEAGGYPTGGEFVAGPCLGSVQRTLRIIRAALSKPEGK